MSQSISVVVPVYNSQESLLELYRRLVKVLTPLTSDDYEIVFVDDGSIDESWSTLLEIKNRDHRVLCLRFRRNSGQHNALLAGIRAATKQLVVTIDDDLQNPPEEIPNMLSELEQDFDVVYGHPPKQKHGVLRNAASTITKIALQGPIGAQNARHVSAFRIFKTNLRDSFSGFENPFVSIDVLLTWGTQRFSHVEVRQDERKFSESGYTISKLFRHALNMITGFTTLPLQLASFLGFSFSAIGFVSLLYTTVRWALNQSSVPGFTFLASTLTMFAGVQLLCLGIIGEYLARLHVGGMGRRAYTVSETAGLTINENHLNQFEQKAYEVVGVHQSMGSDT
jgi:glycosyltransferase involved in cell wall biosynthesis